ncbi:mucin-2-like [Paramacrobiotus metropolitanus]|uniref:mucin-2-like n=1 Tax=Paramacrobiotus metropolitanus TaxID=2943436 RepID=UPI00244560F1|nr:mucin-2-like [Paramacrobiotus metropolitanus]
MRSGANVKHFLLVAFVLAAFWLFQANVMPRNRDFLDEYRIQPGMALGSAYYAPHKSAKTPLKIPQWTPVTKPYYAAAGAGDGPAGWRGQHVYTPKSPCSRCIQPTPTSSSPAAAPSTCHVSTRWRRITETTTTCSPTVCTAPCLTLSTSFTETVVVSMCIRTARTVYLTTVREVDSSTVTLVVSKIAPVLCNRHIGLQTPDPGSGVTLSTDGNPCYSIAVTPAPIVSTTCTLDVQQTTYESGITTGSDGSPTPNAQAQLDPVTSSATTCTFS